MIFGKRKREKIKQNIIDNLTYCRLMGDLMAVEASIRDNAPRAQDEDGGRIKKFVNGIINEINNAARAYTVRELSLDKSKAQSALTSFRAQHPDLDLSISNNTEDFRKYIDKSLFKNDKDGLQRLTFALVFAIDERGQEYQCQEESLEVVSEILFDDPKRLGKIYSAYKNNYVKLRKSWAGEFESGLGIGTGLGGAMLLSLMPMCVTGIFALAGYFINKKAADEAFKNMSPIETNAMLALRLTVFEMAEISEAKKKEMADELLTHISSIRSDAEYKWYVEGIDIPECMDKIESCNLALARLGKILGV